MRDIPDIPEITDIHIIPDIYTSQFKRFYTRNNRYDSIYRFIGIFVGC